MSEATILDRIRGALAAGLFWLAGRVDDAYDVWLDDAPRRTHQPGDDEYPDPFADYANLRWMWREALLTYEPPDTIPAGGWHRVMPDSDEADRIFPAFVACAFSEHREAER